MLGLTVIRHVPDVKRRHLHALRGHPDHRVRVRVQRVHGSLEHIQLGRAARLAGRRVRRVVARARREFHAGQEVAAVRRALVRGDAGVALVVVAVGPHAVSRGGVARAAQVAHGPEARPEARDVAGAGHGDAGLEAPTGEAQLVPALHHAGAVVEVVVAELVEADLQHAVLGRDRVRVVPLQVLRHAVPQVHGLVVGVVAVVEGAAFCVEFVGELASRQPPPPSPPRINSPPASTPSRRRSSAASPNPGCQGRSGQSECF